MAILRILCYNVSLVTRTVVSLITVKFEPLSPPRLCTPHEILLGDGERNVLRIISKRTTQAQTNGLR
jgi:hypothetical protein